MFAKGQCLYLNAFLARNTWHLGNLCIRVSLKMNAFSATHKLTAPWMCHNFSLNFQSNLAAAGFKLWQPSLRRF